jgi:peroxiredoxin Q/BCP
MATPKQAPTKKTPAKPASAKKAPAEAAPNKTSVKRASATNASSKSASAQPSEATAARAPATKAPTKAAAKSPAAKTPGATGSKAGALAVGAAAPAFSLVADDGRTVSLASLRGKKVVLYFYPKDDTPGCTRESCAFNESLAALADKGATVLGVSRDGTASHVRFKQKYGLAFPLLSDPDASVHKAYGAWGTKTLYGKTSEGVIRTTVVIDAAGKVAKIFGNVKVDGHAEKVLASL